MLKMRAEVCGFRAATSFTHSIRKLSFVTGGRPPHYSRHNHASECINLSWHGVGVVGMHATSRSLLSTFARPARPQCQVFGRKLRTLTACHNAGPCRCSANHDPPMCRRSESSRFENLSLSSHALCVVELCAYARTARLITASHEGCSDCPTCLGKWHALRVAKPRKGVLAAAGRNVSSTWWHPTMFDPVTMSKKHGRGLHSSYRDSDGHLDGTDKSGRCPAYLSREVLSQSPTVAGSSSIT
ncbi:hypothetical protein B0H21DRAFT_515377 [Amylocystis lapponica]|nr:hypothetical protein B0H21DRAFT_515377 [Amylocystis lapponica]